MTINHTKKEWSEVMEYQPFCPHIQMLVGNAFTRIYSNGKVSQSQDRASVNTQLLSSDLSGPLGGLSFSEWVLLSL